MLEPTLIVVTVLKWSYWRLWSFVRNPITWYTKKKQRGLTAVHKITVGHFRTNFSQCPIKLDFCRPHFLYNFIEAIEWGTNIQKWSTNIETVYCALSHICELNGKSSIALSSSYHSHLWVMCSWTTCRLILCNWFHQEFIIF